MDACTCAATNAKAMPLPSNTTHSAIHHNAIEFLPLAVSGGDDGVSNDAVVCESGA